ncbi:corepressor interacting with RBPJ 1 [Lingula anatina]|uniref:Corepressor interacting with RBPJ 1 n=1 Tax=Lingula anatina TaxID=7574 RepID=A0A1S3JUH9_LINAN|nr:corepressor interacting with RBPJ 1 [Lingula anatina]|eukprot:XP_013413751.1 corepressor interacting with RBPJ 1 [Lingula anatina]
MGKGYNNYMSKKFFHPATFENIKRVWMAQQKIDHAKAKEEERLAQYQREQDVYQNKALLGDEKAKIGLSFMYEPPPGANRAKEKEDDEPEYKFEWQRKFNAPRENYAKGDETIRDQPFGIEVRNVRCIKCKKWGHVNTDKICPLFGKNLTAEPPAPGSSVPDLAGDMEKDQGLKLKQNVLGKKVNPYDRNQQLVESDQEEEDPEVAFLKSLTPKQKKKLLKKLDKLQRQQSGEEKKKKKQSKKRKHSKRDSSEDSDSESEPDRKRKTSKKNQRSDIDDSEDEVREPKKGYGKNKYVRRRSPQERSRHQDRPDSRRDDRRRSPPDSRREKRDRNREDDGSSRRPREISPPHREERDRRDRSPRRRRTRSQSPQQRERVRSRSPHKTASRSREERQNRDVDRRPRGEDRNSEKRDRRESDRSRDRERSNHAQGHSKTRPQSPSSSSSSESSESSSDSESEAETKFVKREREEKRTEQHGRVKRENGERSDDRREKNYDRKTSHERPRDISKRK